MCRASCCSGRTGSRCPCGPRPRRKPNSVFPPSPNCKSPDRLRTDGAPASWENSLLALQILIDGFAISALYGLGAVGFTLIFGVSGVLNLSHGAIMVVAAVTAWATAGSLGFGRYGGAAAGVFAGFLLSYATYFLVVRPIQSSRAIPREEKEIFVLTGTLLWGIMIQEAIAYFFSNTPKTVLPLWPGVVGIAGVRTPANEVVTLLVSLAAIGLLWLLINRT